MSRRFLIVRIVLCIAFLVVASLLYVPQFFSSKSPSLSVSFTQFQTSLGVPQVPSEYLNELAPDHKFLQKAKTYFKALQSFSHGQKREDEISPIPKIIHQFWLYNEPPSEEVQYAMATLRQRNPSYTYILWTKETLRPYLTATFGTHLSYLHDLMSVSDYAAASILDKMGGIVVDPWCECIAPIDSLFIPSVRMIIGVEPPLSSNTLEKRRLFASPACIAAQPGHPFLTLWKNELLSRLKAVSIASEEYFKGSYSHNRMVWISLCSLTDVLTQYTSSDAILDAIAVMGPSWWCPISPRYIHRYLQMAHGTLQRSLITKFYEYFHIGVPPFSFIREESVFIHLTGGRLGMASPRLKEHRGEVVLIPESILQSP